MGKTIEPPALVLKAGGSATHESLTAEPGPSLEGIVGKNAAGLLAYGRTAGTIFPIPFEESVIDATITIDSCGAASVSHGIPFSSRLGRDTAPGTWKRAYR